MLKISKIKKKANGKYELYISDGRKVSLYDEVILKYRILLKKEIEEDKLEQWTTESAQLEYYQKALKNLSRKNRSEKEIRTFFSKNGVEQSLQDLYIEKLKSLGYLKENQYLESYIHDRLCLTLEGPLKITKDLEEEGFTKDAIDAILSTVSNEEWRKRISLFIEKQLKKQIKGSSFNLKNKLLESLFRLGYSKEMSTPFIENITFDHSSNLEKEYEKLYRKLSRQYQGFELEMKIKQKLYQKGYPIEEIQDYQKK